MGSYMPYLKLEEDRSGKLRNSVIIHIKFVHGETFIFHQIFISKCIREKT